ncbi:MAG: DUF1844 domain-containing protein [Planctomycetaceae bacterium]|jgi:hypothetical protein|nr:DUF1844 domain-containing protein [Planctomycetaceae bacterium]
MSTENKEPQDVPLPEPSLIALVTGIATQAMVSMGIFASPTGETEIKLNQAKHLIETIVMLEEKTKGNRTDEESTKISNALHELRMIYIAAQKEQERRKNNPSD